MRSGWDIIMRAVARISRAITGIAAIAAFMGFASAGGSALAATPLASVALPAAAPVASPGIYAPPDTVVGEADGQVDLAVRLSAPGQSTVTVSYSTSNGTASGSFNSCQFANSAFVNTSGTLTFPPGVTTQTVTVTLLEIGR